MEKARLINADLRGAIFLQTNLKGAYLDNANLEEAYMNSSPCFDFASLHGANLKNAHLGPATFRNARLYEANLENANLSCANFSGADLRGCNLKNTKSTLAANFQNALLFDAHLEGANLYKCNFSGVDFRRAIVDSTTSLYQCEVNLDTDFRCVPIDGIGIDSTTKRLLEYNNRRKNWNDWYWRTTWEDQKKIFIKCDNSKQTIKRTTQNLLRYIKTLPIRFFWWMSDYGASPRNLIKAFFIILFLFAFLYCVSSKSICNLPNSKEISSGKLSRINLFVRSVYFSTVTMTTLGFGDIHPESDSKLIQIAVIFQVLLSYILLGAIITYLGILFTSGGPLLNYTYPHR